MKRNYFITVILLLFVFIGFTSCQQKNKEQQTPQQQKKQIISDYAKNLLDNPSVSLDVSKADTLINLLSDYINDYPEDTIGAYYLYIMANVYANTHNCQRAIDCLTQIIQKYPKGSYVGAAYFFKGVFYKDVCDNREKSVEAFEEYIRRYPDNPHVEEAKKLMQMDTMQHPENIIKQ